MKEPLSTCLVKIDVGMKVGYDDYQGNRVVTIDHIYITPNGIEGGESC